MILLSLRPGSNTLRGAGKLRPYAVSLVHEAGGTRCIGTGVLREGHGAPRHISRNLDCRLARPALDRIEKVLYAVYNMAGSTESSSRSGDTGFAVPAVERPKDLSDEVYERLRAAILEGHLRPGVRLVETRLSAQFGISRTPLREALQKLEQEGLVSSRPGGGVMVVELSKRDIQEISGIRQVLEGYAAKLAATRLTEQEMDRLAQIVESTEKALRRGDRAEVAALNAEFHGIINRAAGSKRLLKLINGFRQYFFNTKVAEHFTDDELRESIEGHWRILKALRARDGEAADREVREHLAHAAVIQERMVAR